MSAMVEGRHGRVTGRPLPRWLTAARGFWTRHFRKLIWCAAVLVCVVQLVRLGSEPTGDFPVHHEFGRRLLAGEYIYEPVPGGDPRGHDYPYPPFWALVHAPLSLFPVTTAQLLCFPLFLVSLAALLWVLRDLVRAGSLRDADHAFWLTALATIAASRFLFRDMLECGVNLSLVAMSWTAVWLWRQGRDWTAGWMLGLATALKCTPALFAGYFLVKREWKPFLGTVLATVVLSVLPVFWMGAEAYSEAITAWTRNALVGGLVSSNGVEGVLGEEPLQNMSLRPALTRYLTALPAGHIARLDDPLYIDFARLPAETAGLISRVCLLLLAGCVVWRFRAPARDRGSLHVVWEGAVLSLAILLYSPITWGQHCVGVLPAVFLLIWFGQTRQDKVGWHRLVVWFYLVITLGLNRALVGQRMAWLIDSYHLQTWALLGLLLVLLDAHRREGLKPQAERSAVDCRSQTSDVRHLASHLGPGSPAVSG